MILDFNYYEWQGKLLPLVRLTFEHSGIKIPYLCLLDSGAERTVSYTVIGQNLGIDFKDCPVEQVSGIGIAAEECHKCGEKIKMDMLAYKKEINLFIEGYGNNPVPVEVLFLIKKFDPSSDFTFMIGRRTFFERFDITFQESRKKFYLKPV